ncbi:MAG: aminotransferase class V-fold PLP-dependent enzyme [Phycisphaerales bacterium]|nr:aminotransferase class V-fold PLP-dependent enzyme [Planctomycetota bacterium]MCH8508983.1 aminotransferase class V-fold PLP-dependent enzyme [Phycisphaerales bacterium]
MATTPLPAPSDLARHFRLDPGVVHLNHGSFGACPTPVLDAQARHRDQVEADGVRFFVHDAWPLLDRARAALAPIVGADPANLAFVANATTGVTTALHNIPLGPGDEILVTGAEYTACVNNCRAAARRAGASVVTADLPWPAPGPDAVADALLSKVTARTRVVMLSLVASSTGLRLPVERILPALRNRGVITILDAAHGPGCVPMRLRDWAPDFATGNAHKWLCAPKGSAFLYVAPEHQAGFRPLVLSNDAERLEEAAARTGRSPWQHELDYAGTDDPSAKIAIADAAAFLAGLFPGGLDAVMDHNHALCRKGRDIVCARLGLDPSAPDAMTGPMAALILPGVTDPMALWDRLYHHWRIQIPVWPTPGGTVSLRLSAQVYNTPAQYEYLAKALAHELGATR